MERIENLDLCAKCGGLCCLKGPGKYNPNDFASDGGLTQQMVNDALDDGRAIISTTLVSVEGSQAAPVFTLTARGKNREPLSLCHEAASCALLVDDRCRYALDERPYECAMLVPSENPAECRLPDNLLMEILWIDHQRTMRSVIEQRTGHHWRKEMVEQVLHHKDAEGYSQGIYDYLTKDGLVEDDEEADETIAEWQLSRRLAAKAAK